MIESYSGPGLTCGVKPRFTRVRRLLEEYRVDVGYFINNYDEYLAGWEIRAWKRKIHENEVAVDVKIA